jgi:hypothetical protein
MRKTDFTKDFFETDLTVNVNWRSSKDIAKKIGTRNFHVMRRIRELAKNGRIESWQYKEGIREKFGRGYSEILFDEALLPFILGAMSTKTHDANYLYVVQFDNGLKVGCCKNITNRMMSYQRPWCYPFLRSKDWKTEKASQLEKEVITRFKSNSKASSKEYFYGLSFNELVAWIEKRLLSV